MMRTLLLLATLYLAVIPLQAQLTSPAPVAPVLVQPPLRGLVTITQPEGQFYINLGSKEQLYPGSVVRILRDGAEIGRADILKVNHLDAIASLWPIYQGLRLRSADTVEVIYNPIPVRQRTALPKIEPNPDMREREALVVLVTLVIIGDLLID